MTKHRPYQNEMQPQESNGRESLGREAEQEAQHKQYQVPGINVVSFSYQLAPPLSVVVVVVVLTLTL